MVEQPQPQFVRNGSRHNGLDLARTGITIGVETIATIAVNPIRGEVNFTKALLHPGGNGGEAIVHGSPLFRLIREIQQIPQFQVRTVGNPFVVFVIVAEAEGRIFTDRGV